MQQIVRTCFLIALMMIPLNIHAQTISWSPSALSLQILGGTARSIKVSFTASNTLTNVDLSVVPELQPLLSITPSHISSLPTNAIIDVLLVFSIAEHTIPGSYDGVIKLRQSGRTIPSPLPIILLVQRPSSALIPGSISIPSVDRVAIDSETQVSYAKDELILFSSPGATQKQISALVGRFGGRFLGHDEALGAYQIFIVFPDLTHADTISSQLRQDPIVSFVRPSLFLSAHSIRVPNDAAWTGTDIFLKTWAAGIDSSARSMG
jgi:hypothetical protein